MSATRRNLPPVLRMADWPDQDRRLLEAGCRYGSILDGTTYAQDLRPVTMRNIIKSYSCFVGVLRSENPACLALSPADRITPSNMRAYLHALLERRNCRNTFITRVMELRSALRIMYPERDFGWLTCPGGASLRRLLPIRRKTPRVLDIVELARWGRELMEEGLRQPSRRGAILFRNGLLIAVLADRAPRQRSLSLLRLGRGIWRNGVEYTVHFSAKETKGNKQLCYELHPALTPNVDHYLEVVRPRLLRGKGHDWFWVNQEGDRLVDIGIGGVIRRASKSRFGFAFGAHFFRYSLATSGMIANPQTPALVAGVLGNMPVVAERYYVLGGQVEAAKVLHTTLTQLRDDG